MDIKIIDYIKNNINLDKNEMAKNLELTIEKLNLYILYMEAKGVSSKLGIRNKINAVDPVKISYEADQIILGSLLGDGSLIRKRTNCLLSINHSLVQKEYAMYKYDMINRSGLKCYTRIPDRSSFKSIIDGREILDNGSIRIDSIVNSSLNIYRTEWYSPKKEVPDSVFRLGPIGLAIWFMDDGSKNKSSYYLSTNGFSLSSCEKLRLMLKLNFGIFSSIHKNKNSYILYINAKSRELFTSIIEKYLCNSMKYKLFVIGHNKQGELLETPQSEDNQQPSLDSNILEGSETNSRFHKMESNTDTSALLTISSDEDIVRTMQ